MKEQDLLSSSELEKLGVDLHYFLCGLSCLFHSSRESSLSFLKSARQCRTQRVHTGFHVRPLLGRPHHSCPCGFMSLLPKSLKEWRSCVPCCARDKLTIVEQLVWHSPEASNLISLYPWPWSTATAKCVEVEKQSRRGVMSAERRRLPESAEVIFYRRERGRLFQLHHSGSLAQLHAHTTPVTPTHVTLLQIKSFNSFQNQDVSLTECSGTIFSNWGSFCVSKENEALWCSAQHIRRSFH